jgi:thiol-disulfide isomerase/thioredoxin
MRRLAAVVMSGVTAVLLSSCASLIGIADGSQTSPGLHPLEFSAKTLAGDYFSGQSLTGRPAVLWFWTPSCVPCQTNAPSVVEAARAHPSVTFVGVASQDGLVAIKQFATRYGLDGSTELADLDGAVWRHFEITSPPAFVFIAGTGATQIVREAVSTEALDAQLDALAKTA